MCIKVLRRIVKAKNLCKRIIDNLSFTVETIAYAICCTFLMCLLIMVAYYGYFAIIEHGVLKYYILGLMIILSTVVSLSYISKYHEKYRKNDSNSSNGQNDFFFEEDIRGERKYYSD